MGDVGVSNYNPESPAIDGARIVWQQDSSGHQAVYVKNIKTGNSGKVLTSTHNQVKPSISGTRVVWSQEDTTNHWNIYIKNLDRRKWPNIYINP